MKYRSRIDETGWLPIPDEVLAALGWKEGDYVEIEIVGDCLVCTKSADHTPAPKPTVHPAPRSRRTN